MVRVHLERHGPGARSLDLSLEAETLVRRWGPLDGPSAGERREALATPEAAARALDRQIARAVGKGYWVGHHDPDLLSTIAREVDDEGGYLVYGDWLLERDDPRGELVHADPPGRAALLEAHPRALRPLHWGPRVHVEWWRGFARGLAVRLDGHIWGAADDARRLTNVLGHPSCHVLSVFALESRPLEQLAPGHRGLLNLREFITSALHRLPSTTRQVAVSPALASLAQDVLPPEQVVVVRGSLHDWVVHAARPPAEAR